jgi:hypothetical protein
VTNLFSASRSARYDDAAHSFAGNQYWGMPLPSFKPNEEGISTAYASLVQNAYQSNAVVFACELTRMALFSEARFQWRRLYNGKPGDMFGNSDLSILEKPWPKGTTGDLLSRLLVDADMAGTAFLAREADRPDRLRRMRPDWVTMVLGSQDEPDDANVAMDAEFLGVIYHPGGPMSGKGTPKALLADEVTYFAPIPDPLAAYRGMSWLTPLIREIEADSATTAHKLMFFRNGATPQMVVSMGENVSETAFQSFVAKMDGAHDGWQNAYKTLYLGGGADATVVGQNLQQLDFKVTQGAGETRIAAASGVHPVLVGLSEGLAGSSLNDGNFRAACRLVADRTLRPLWRNVAGSLEDLVPAPPGTELWYDERDIAFLQENQRDAAEIQFVQAQTLRQLVDAQFTAESSVAAVVAKDMTLLDHTGIPTVQGQQQSGLIPPAPLNGSTNGSPNGKPVLK